MNKNIISNILLIISVILLLILGINVYDDYMNRENIITLTLSSVIMIRVVEFLIPSFICCIVGIIMKSIKKGKEKNEKTKV